MRLPALTSTERLGIAARYAATARRSLARRGFHRLQPHPPFFRNLADSGCVLYERARDRGYRLGNKDQTTNVRLELSTTSERAAVRRARHALATLDELHGNDRVSFNARLLVSELVTNAVTHGATEHRKHVHLLAEIVGHVLHIEVSDGGPGFLLGQDDPDPPDPGSTSGRGLYLLRTLADRYGVNDQTHRGQVWFELDL
ncbi:MAG TPA: ATP-binding protein [Gaiellaceae bacterium]|nr:ATP-binding protein [Gaiellaceae bacterium]